MTKLTWYEKSGSGLVDVEMECGDSKQRFTNNNNGSPNKEKVCMDGFSQLQGLEQEKDGIINVRMNCVDDSEYLDSNGNRAGSWNRRLTCPKGVFTGLEIRVKTGSESRIINFKALCTDLPKGR